MIRRFALILLCMVPVLSQACFAAYLGTLSQTFDKSENPYGWFYGYNRKIQTNLDPVTGEMICSLYRRLTADVDGGVIGGMAGVWNGDGLTNFNVPVEVLSPFTGSPMPGSRDPYTCGFINGYTFGLFNHYDTSVGEEASFPYFTTGDATWGWDTSVWSEPKLVESSDSSSVVPSAWKGTGDVVYDPDSGYYYWTQGWKEGNNDLVCPVSCVMGNTKTPSEPDSWIWTDYKDLRFDTDNIIDKYSDVSKIGPFHLSYAKDIYGNGTGKGVGVAVTDPDSSGILQLSYIYTNNWGEDWNKTSMGFHHQSVSELFDWVGESLTLTDSVELGYNLDSLSVVGGTGEITIDYARIMWDISVITTEENAVHVLCMVFPASTEYPNCIFPWTDSGFRAGYYDIRGEITETGINWLPAVFIANPMVNSEAWPGTGINLGMEFVSDINRTLSLSYAGYDRIFATWLDRPGGREMYTDEIPGCRFRDDGFLIISLDGGDTWQLDKTVSVETGDPDDPVHYLKYAANVTKTSNLHEEGWTLSLHGAIETNDPYTFAACQYADITAEIGMTYMDYERLLKVWHVKYYTSGIEPEEVSIASDFELYQNYPNPFNPSTEIKFSLAENSKVNLCVYNTNGQLIKTLIDGKTEKGLHSVRFHGEELNSGIYFYRLETGGKAETRKMIMLK